MIHRALLWCALGAFLLSGCSLLYDDSVVDGKTECTSDDECLFGEYCEQKRCLMGPRPVRQMPEMGTSQPETMIEPIEPMDVGPDDGTDSVEMGLLDVDCCVPELPESGMPDAGDMGVPDTYDLPFPNGECFAGEGGILEPPPESESTNQVPYALCTAYGWIRTMTQEGDAWLYTSNPPALGPAHPYRYREGTNPVMFGPRLVMSRFNQDFDDAINLYWVDLVTGEHGWLREGPYDQFRPVTGDGFMAFIESMGPNDSSVVLIREDLQALVCGAESGIQWGVGASGSSLAWFERPTSARRDRVVTVRVIDPLMTRCPALTRQRLLSGIVDRAVGVHLTDTHAHWLEREPGSFTNVLYGWAFGDPRAEDPAPYGAVDPSQGAPVDLVTAENLIVLVRYQRSQPRYSFQFFPNALQATVAPRDDVRRPSLSARYLMWAQYKDDLEWEVHYAPLP